MSIKRTHPNLWLAVTFMAVISVALGVNFIFNNPAHPPFDLNKNIVGIFFLLIGVSELWVLNYTDKNRLLKKIMAFSVSYMAFIGLGYVLLYARGTLPSLQPAILYLGFALTAFPPLLEPPINPITYKGLDNGQ